MPERWINWQLLMNPGNWLIVFLMVAVGALGVTAIWTALATRAPSS